MRKIVGTIAATLAAVMLITLPAAATENLVLQTGEELPPDPTIELQALQQQLADVITAIENAEKELVTTGQKILAAQQDLDEAEAIRKKQYHAMKLRIRYFYENGSAELFEAVLNATDLADVMNRVEYANNLTKYDRNLLTAYITTENQIRTLKAQLEEEQKVLEEQKTEFVARQEELNEMIEVKQQEVEHFNAILAAAVEQALTTDTVLQEAVATAIATGDFTALEEMTAGSGGGTVAYSAAVMNAIIEAAYSQIGVGYVWGASSPGVAFDCSGFVQYCYQQAGIYVPHQSGQIAAMGTQTYDPKPGDICWWPGHVAMYIGDGQYIDSQQDGTTIQVRDFNENNMPIFYQIGSYTEDAYAYEQSQLPVENPEEYSEEEYSEETY